jgi:hypothetical protein
MTLNSKKKPCDGTCGETRMIWKNHEGKRYCLPCWKAHSGSTKVAKTTGKRKRLPLCSPKRSQEERLYSGKRILFLEKHSMCQASLSGKCTLKSTDVHHMCGRSGSLYLDETQWLAVCRTCHDWIEKNPADAKALGFTKSRLS